MIRAGIIGLLVGFGCMGMTMLAATVEGSPFYGISDPCAGTVGLGMTVLVGFLMLAFSPKPEPPEVS